MHRIAVVLLFVVTLPLHAALVAGVERPVAPQRIEAPASNQWVASIASSGHSSLVVWVDQRLYSNVFSALLDENGRPIAGTQRHLGYGVLPTVTWTGEAYVVLWYVQAVTQAAIIDRTGEVVEAPRVVVTGIPSSNIASRDGRSYFVYANAGTTAVAVLDGRGQRLRDDLDVPLAGQAASAFAVVPIDGGCIVLWSEWTPTATILKAARAMDSGNVSAAVTIGEAAIINGKMDAAFDGNRIALVFGEGNVNPAIADRLRRILIDPATLAASELTPIALEKGNSIGGVEAANGAFIAYASTSPHSRIVTFRFTESDERTPFAELLEHSPTDLAAAWNGTRLVFAWSEATRVNADNDVVASAVDAASAAGPSLVSYGRTDQRELRAAGDGTTSLIAWLEPIGVADSYRVVAAHATHGVVDTTPLVLGISAGSGINVVFTGSGYFVTWSAAGVLTMQRVALDGTPAGAPIEVPGAGNGGVAWNGSHLLVAYPANLNLFGVRYTSAGTLVDTTPRLLATNPAQEVAVASNGTDFLVVWTEGDAWWQFPAPQLIDVVAIRVGVDGSPVSAPIGVATGSALQILPAVASDGRDFAVAYRSAPRLGFETAHIEVKKVLREGLLASGSGDDHGTIVTEAGAWPERPSILFAGGAYIVAAAGEQVINVARLDRDVNLLELRNSAALADRGPFLAPGPGATAHLFYSRLTYDPIYGDSYAAFTKIIEEAPPRRRAVR